jgi:hypothetical protein
MSLEIAFSAFCTMVFSRTENGFFLTRDELNASYAIILHNVRTYRSAGVVQVIKGRQNAESAVRKFQESQGSSEHHEGWRYFFERTDTKAGTDPAEATDVRQAELEVRELKAMGGSETFGVRASDTRR